ncbi:hypothetical protein Ahy_A02g008034 isoform F [Arachis hypogaea]|uniref:Uncharacterized protein n=1 Tax=Arachis hypogaea TaxID=3818 RepID=A0A445EDN4_ARAHY|nr:hypothetical protein Ahy_A02g008034 isoform F [Arachis hypogaea]
MAISEASQLCMRFIFRNRMHRVWFRMFMFKERSLWCLRCVWVGWVFVRTIRSFAALLDEDES